MAAPPAPIPAAPARPRPRIAALDGLRGLALLGMLAWHAHVDWVKGGFARMTIFFVLSGYLAAASWLSLRRREVDRPYRTFWRRRVRRLVPLTVVGVALGVAVTAWFGTDGAVRNLRGDATSVVIGASNWRFLLNGQSYGELFERPSAFQHFWSLSLEEQCFWLLPVVLAGALALGGRRAWVLLLAAGAALAAIPLVVHHSPDAAYYGTHVRGGEFLVGVVLAVLLERHGGEVPERWRRPVQAVGAVSLAALVLVMLSVDRTLPWLCQGGLGLFAIPAVAVVAACRAGRGPATVVLSVAPLAIVGRAAFSIYVLHWPLFQVMTPERVGLDGGWLALAQITVGITVGLVAFRWLERPLMDSQRSLAPSGALGRLWADERRAVPALGAAAAVVVVAALAVPTPPAPYDLRALEARLSDGHHLEVDEARTVLETTPVVATAARPAVPLPNPADEVRIGFFGGSTSVALGAVGGPWTEQDPSIELAPGYARLGCGLVTEGLRTFGQTPEGEPKQAPPDDYCLDWQLRWPATATIQQLDVAVVMTGVWETADWVMGDPPTARHVGDPAFDLLLALRLHEAIDRFEERGVAVVLVTTPVIGEGADGTARQRRHLGPDHAQRVARFNELVQQVAAEHPGVEVIDYGGFVDGLAPETSAGWLPDGIHPTEAAGATIWRQFLGPALLDAVVPAPPAGDGPGGPVPLPPTTAAGPIDVGAVTPAEG